MPSRTINGDGGSPTENPPPFLDEVNRIVTTAAADGAILQIGRYAKQLSASAAALGLSQRSIADELIRAASRAGVAVEMDNCD